MKVFPIRTKADHAMALERIAKLMHAKAGSKAGDELDILTTLVEAYESQSVKIPKIDPVEAILHRMEALDLTRKDLEKYIGSRARVSEILNRKRPLTLHMIRALHRNLSIPAELLIAA